MIRILLIRHGSTDLLGRVLYGRMPGVHLNAEGASQANALAQALKMRYAFEEVISSPMERAVETARPIAQAQNLDLSIDESFDEIDFGEWMGTPFAELHQQELWKRYCQSRSTARPPGGESIMDVQSRAWRGLDRVISRHRHRNDSTVAIVTHGDVVRALLMLLLGMSIDHIHRIEAAPASVSEVLIRQSSMRVRTVNETFSPHCISDF